MKREGTCKYINKWGVEYKEHVVGHVRAWEGEEIEWKKSLRFIQNKSQKKGRTSD
jgi:hypothetical protein